MVISPIIIRLVGIEPITINPVGIELVEISLVAIRAKTIRNKKMGADIFSLYRRAPDFERIR